jgi:hypothetical protein
VNKAQGVASELEASLRELLGVLGEGGATADAVGQLQTRCHDLTNALVEATTTCTATELGEAKPALQRAQRLNAIARGVVEAQRDAAGAQIAGAQRIKRTLGSDAPVSDGQSCDVRA